MDILAFSFAWLALLFMSLWVHGLFKRRELAERHLTAIRFALDFSEGNWWRARRFLCIYLDGDQERMRQHFPQFWPYAQMSEGEWE